MSKLVAGMKVRYVPQPEWGVGHLVALYEGGTKAQVTFPAREGGPILVSTRQGALIPNPFGKGDSVATSKGQRGVITGEVEGGRGLRRYVVRFEGETEEDEWPESELRAVAPKPDALTMLKEHRVGDARNFLLRRSALHLDDERRCDALGALLASRVMVKPHQVGVVQRVLSARRPRFVLADEVGLGKTIEAGMIFSALRLAGLAKRVLVVAPSHLTVQWLVELFHKFNQMFTLLDGERYAAEQKDSPVSPWARHDKVITSLELLARDEERAAEAGQVDAYWDLVIIDEAHHLKGARAFAAAQALAKNSWGLLLLTATPMQLDPAEYHALLTLIDPATAPTQEGFERRLARQEELSAAVRSLLAGDNSKAALSALAKHFPKDETLTSLTEPKALLNHLAETYSLSDRLIRNRRAVVGGFSERRLHRHPAQQSQAEKAAKETALAALRADGKLKGAALADVLRRLDSSPSAFDAALKSTQALAGLGSLKLPGQDGKFDAFTKLLAEVWAAEPAAKVLVFAESRDTVESLQERLRALRIEALAYHGDLALVERDRQVARFRGPDGPKVLVCTEVGGEGRNFQFAHHLVNYDLPWSPATMEQRIGRLDRIGQSKPVEIHVFDTPGTSSSYVLSVLADAVGVFGETVGGLDAVLEEVEPQLAQLALARPKERAAYAASLKKRVDEARASVRRAYDPLLDVRSFDQEQVRALVQRAERRFGLAEEDDEPTDNPIEDGLWSLARDLDERLEETVSELAKRVGIGVDTDEQVEAFQCAFHFGHELKVEALPGIVLGQDKVALGTFWRDTALEQEEIDYFATGHPIVEALFGFLRDGPYGRNGVRFLEVRGPLRAKGLELVFHIVAPEPEDTSPGAKIPSRQLSRFLDRLLVHVAVARGEGGKPKVDGALLSLLESEGRSLKGDEARAAFPELETFVDPAVEAGVLAAEAEMRRRAQRVKEAILRERDVELARLDLALAHQGLTPKAIAAQKDAEQAHCAQLLAALSKLKIQLDSACGFVINR